MVTDHPCDSLGVVGVVADHHPSSVNAFGEVFGFEAPTITLSAAQIIDGYWMEKQAYPSQA